MYETNDSYLAVVRKQQETVFFTTLKVEHAKVRELELLEEIMAGAGGLWLYFYDLSITLDQNTQDVVVCARSLETSKQMLKRCFRKLSRALMVSGLAQNPMYCEMHLPISIPSIH